MAGSRVDMRAFERSMKLAIEEVEKPATMIELGQEVAERIVQRTRLGKGVATEGGEAEPLKPLSPSYKEFRRGRIAFFKFRGEITVPYKPDNPPFLSRFTTAGRSNLTMTGQMLNALTVIRAVTGRVTLGFKGLRKDAFGRPTELSNEEVAGFVSKDRPFFTLSRAELNGLTDSIRKRIEAAMRKFRS